MEVLQEDKNLIAVYKEAGVPTQTRQVGIMDLFHEVRNYIFKMEQVANPYLAVINRLDQPVEGIVLFAKTPKAAAAFASQMQRGIIKKRYYALTFGTLKDKEGEFFDYIKKDGRTNLSGVVTKQDQAGKPSKLRYRVCASKEDAQFVEIELLTGRHHQIRLQFASRSHPLLGDYKYGTTQSLQTSERYGCHKAALCAYEISFQDPADQKEITVRILPKHPLMRSFLLNGDCNENS